MRSSPWFSLFASLLGLSLGCGPTGPLLAAEGPIPVTASDVATRGVDTGPEVYRLRLRNVLGDGAGICEVNVRRKSDAPWSENQIVRPDTCYYLNEVVVILLPSAGDWFVRVKTSTGQISKLTLRLKAATTEAKIGG